MIQCMVWYGMVQLHSKRIKQDEVSISCHLIDSCEIIIVMMKWVKWVK
jgi:hypothetical protein